MSEAFKTSLRLYWMAKRTDVSNREFNVESKRAAVHDDYHACLRLLCSYCRRHDISIVAYSIWGGRKRLGVKFHGKNVTVGVVKEDDIAIGLTREVKNAFELRRYLENTVGFTVANLNEELFEKAYQRLKKIESQLRIKIDPEETKKWSTQPYYPRPIQKHES
jgi:hypothetical protein